MSDFANPALVSMPLDSGFTVINWCLDDNKNTCRICPCLWNGNPQFYTHVVQPCGPPFVAIASRAEGIKCTTQGEYNEIVPGDYTGPSPVILTSPPIPVQPFNIGIQVYKKYGAGEWTLIETVPWFDLGPGTTTSFWGQKSVSFRIGPPTYPTVIETYIGSTWQSEQIIAPFDLILASQDNPYPNGTYDMIYSDSGGVYDHYTAWMEGPIPDDFPEVLTQYYLTVGGGRISEPSGITFGPWQTNFSSTVTSDIAAYGRDECSYAHEDQGIPPFPPRF